MNRERTTRRAQTAARRVTAALLIAGLLLCASGCKGVMPGMSSEELESISWFNIYLVIMTIIANLLLLALILLLAYKMNRLVEKLDRISEHAGQFLQMGMTYFKKK